MPRYSKTHSNYVKQKKHQDVTDGYIFSRDWVTFGNLHRLEPGKKPFFGDSNFIFTDNSTPVYEKKRGYGKWVARFVYDDVKDAVGDVNEVRVNTNSNDLRSYAYYGSMVDLIRVTIEDIIMNFPARLYSINENLFLIDGGNEWVDTGRKKLSNQFSIDLHSEGILLENNENELRYLSVSWDKYNIVRYDGDERLSEENIVSYDILPPDVEVYNAYKYHEQGYNFLVYQNHLLKWDNGTHRYIEIEYVTECHNYFESCGDYLRYDGVFYRWDAENGEYVKLHYYEICDDNYQKIATIRIATEENVYFVYAYRINGIVYYACAYEGFSIEPKQELIESYFNNIDGLAKKLLSRNRIPLYTARLSTPYETMSGMYLFTDRDYTWPSDGYCIDIGSPSYLSYLDRLMDMAEKYDKVYSDCIWRCMTHETIKNFDWTYRREYSENDALENIEGGQRMEELLHFYGYVYDTAKRYVDGIKMTNKISYDGYDNCADAEISDKNNAKGWDIVSTIWEPCYYEPYDCSGVETGIDYVFTPKCFESKFTFENDDCLSVAYEGKDIICISPIRKGDGNEYEIYGGKLPIVWNPNCATDIVFGWIETPDGKRYVTHYRIVDKKTGDIIAEGDVNGVDVFTFDMSGIPSGDYVVYLTFSGGESDSWVIVKQESQKSCDECDDIWKAMTEVCEKNKTLPLIIQNNCNDKYYKLGTKKWVDEEYVNEFPMAGNCYEINAMMPHPCICDEVSFKIGCGVFMLDCNGVGKDIETPKMCETTKFDYYSETDTILVAWDSYHYTPPQTCKLTHNNEVVINNIPINTWQENNDYWGRITLNTELLTESEYVIEVEYNSTCKLYFQIFNVGPLSVVVRREESLQDCSIHPIAVGLRHQYDSETNTLSIWFEEGSVHVSGIKFAIFDSNDICVYPTTSLTSEPVVLEMNEYPDDEYYMVFYEKEGMYNICVTITKDNYSHIIPDYCITEGGMTFTPYPCLPAEANKLDDQYISVGCGPDALYYEKKCNDPSKEMLTYDFFDGKCTEKETSYVIETGECVAFDEDEDEIHLIPSCNSVYGSGFYTYTVAQDWGSGIGIEFNYDCVNGTVTFNFNLKDPNTDPLPISYTIETKDGTTLVMSGDIENNPVTIDLSSLQVGGYTIRFCGDVNCKKYVDIQYLGKYEEECQGCQDYWNKIKKECGGDEKIPYIIQDADNPSRFYNVDNSEWGNEKFVFDFWNGGSGIYVGKEDLFGDGCTKNVVVKLDCGGCFEIVNCTAIGVDDPDEINEMCKKLFNFKVFVKGNLLIIDWAANTSCVHYIIKNNNDEVIVEEYGHFTKPLGIDLTILTENGYTIEMDFDRLSMTMAIDIEKCHANETFISLVETTHDSTPMIVKETPWINYSQRSTRHLAYVELSGNPSCDLGDDEWDESNTFSSVPYVISEASPRFIRVVNNYTTRYYMLSDAGIDHRPYTHDRWYSAINPNSVTPLSCDIDYQRRLNLSTNRIFKTKGTKHAIDMVMGLFGYGRNNKSELHCNSDYALWEMCTFSTMKGYDDAFYFYELLDDAPDHEFTENETYQSLPLWNGEWSSEYIRVGSNDIYTYFRLNSEYTVSEAIRQLYLHRTSEKMYNDWYTGVPIGDYYEGNTHYVIPYYDKKRVYEGNLYFQQKGGWGRMPEIFGMSDDSQVEWMETVPYLHVLPSVEDLLSVLSIDLRQDDIYYVADLMDYVNFDEDVPYNLSHFFKINDRYNPQRFSSWLNVPMTGEIVYNKNYNVDGVTHDDYVHAKYLADIVSTSLFNNPHIGYGDYDMGRDYLNYMFTPYKYSVDNYYFDNMKYNYMAQQMVFDMESIPFRDGLAGYMMTPDPGIDDIPVFDDVPSRYDTTWDMPEYIKVWWGYGYNYFKRVEFDKVENRVNGNLIPNDLYILNDKVLVLQNLNNNVYHRQYMKDVVLKYVLQVIPSTTILMLTGFDSNANCCLTYYNLSVEPSNPEYGNVYGGGRYLTTTYAVLVAEENEGYHFVRWEKVGEDKNTVVVSENSTVQVLVCENDTYIAVFEEDCIITAGCKTTCKMTFECETQEPCATVFLCETEEQCDVNFTCTLPDSTGSI